MRNYPIIVIGAGVSGISTGIVLQACGFKVTVLSQKNPLDTSLNPNFASLFPAASIIPHTVFHPEEDEIFLTSKEFFAELEHKNYPGLDIHQHFELFSQAEELPSYTKLMDNFGIFDSSYSSIFPKHSTIEAEFGWFYNCYFADWNIYYPALIDTFASMGGTIEYRTVHPEDLKQLDSEIIINCAGIEAPALNGESFNPVIYKGHLLNAKGVPTPKDELGRTISYNFTPGSEVYSTDSGEMLDIYGYPRRDGFVLGGSRIKGTVDEAGNWISDDGISETELIDGEQIPKKIKELHADILSTSFGIDLANYPEILSKVGYRFVGNGEEQLRIDSIELGSKTVINNYGHGGAGVTLSWGCSLRVLQLLGKIKNIPELDSNELVKRLTS